ncbi:MAG: ABC transporter ATP-binding protein [bacterium]
MSDHVVEARALSRVYTLGETEVHALRRVDLEIERGDMMAIVGPSGSGKSTLMNIIGCLDSPTSGTIHIDGEDVSSLTESELALIRNERVGFVFQAFNLLPRISILENVMTPLLYAGIPLRKRRRLSQEALASVGLADRVHHRPNQLSGGQRQRAAIARALVTRPSLLLADEPTGALDTETGKEIMALFHEINEAGTTVIIVTHEHEVSRECRRVVHLRDGTIEDAA